MQRLTGWLGLAISWILFHGPAGLRRAVGNFLAFLWFDLLRIRRREVLNNLKLAFPEMSERDRIRLGRKSLQNLGLNFVEYCYLPWLSPQNYEQCFQFYGMEILEDALKRGRGALLLTLHLGHGDLACAALSLRGFPIIMVSKFFKAKWLNDLWFGMRARLGTKFVPPRDSSYALLKGLKTGHAVILPLDQFTGPPIGVRTTFFGVETGTAAGLAVMAERSKAPVLSCYTWRQPDGRHGVKIVREMVAGDAAPEIVTQRFNDELETFVREHPDQWMWIHRRWKKFKY